MFERPGAKVPRFGACLFDSPWRVQAIPPESLIMASPLREARRPLRRGVVACAEDRAEILRKGGLVANSVNTRTVIRASHVERRRRREDCLKIGATVHFASLHECGHVGCCDSSPNKHATKHFHGRNRDHPPSSPARTDVVHRRTEVGHDPVTRPEGRSRINEKPAGHGTRFGRLPFPVKAGEAGRRSGMPWRSTTPARRPRARPR